MREIEVLNKVRSTLFSRKTILKSYFLGYALVSFRDIIMKIYEAYQKPSGQTIYLAE